MISKNKIKEIRQLHQKKGRQKHHSFIVEGEKMVKELLVSDYGIEEILALPSWLSETGELLGSIKYSEISDNDLKKISTLKTPNKVIAITQIKKPKLDHAILIDNLCLGIESLQDPGNFGTILRIANWFGIKHIICSNDTVDIYNPKVVQATMGSIFRVQVYYTDLVSFVQTSSKRYPVYGTFVNSPSIYDNKLGDHGLIIFGNESKGISSVLSSYITHRVSIPAYPSETGTMDSLNVSTAVAITCAEFRRQHLYSK